MTAGVVNAGSDDGDICRFLNLERVEIAPFTPVTKEAQEANLKLMEDADVILVADVPFGKSNLRNLLGLESRKGRIFFHKNALSNDYTEGRLVSRLEELGKEKEIIYFGDHDEFMKMLDKLQD